MIKPKNPRKILKNPKNRNRALRGGWGWFPLHRQGTFANFFGDREGFD